MILDKLTNFNANNFVIQNIDDIPYGHKDMVSLYIQVIKILNVKSFEKEKKTKAV